MDVVWLARIQFSLTIMFHFLFPPITIGLAFLVAIVEAARWKTGDDLYRRMSDFWLKVFAATFAVGVATGITMEFQFGTNWAGYSRFVGDIFGAPLAAEGVLAFFLESGFLGLLLLGRDRISSGLRFFAACMVSLGSTLSGFWIIVANSWMQTPAGFQVRNGRAELTSFTDAVFNPSTWPRFLHTVASAWVAAGFLVAGISAWYLLKGRSSDVARASRVSQYSVSPLSVAPHGRSPPGSNQSGYRHPWLPPTRFISWRALRRAPICTSRSTFGFGEPGVNVPKNCPT